LICKQLSVFFDRSFIKPTMDPDLKIMSDPTNSFSIVIAI